MNSNNNTKKSSKITNEVVATRDLFRKYAEILEDVFEKLSNDPSYMEAEKKNFKVIHDSINAARNKSRKYRIFDKNNNLLQDNITVGRLALSFAECLRDIGKEDDDIFSILSDANLNLVSNEKKKNFSRFGKFWITINLGVTQPSFVNQRDFFLNKQSELIVEEYWG